MRAGEDSKILNLYVDLSDLQEEPKPYKYVAKSQKWHDISECYLVLPSASIKPAVTAYAEG